MWIGNSGDTQTEWNPTIANNTLTNIAATGIATHVVGATIQGNLVDGSGGSGIKVVPPGGAGQLTTISGNTLRNIAGHGVQIDNAEPTTSFNIQNNNIENVGVSGVYVEGSAFANSTIAGNTINSKAEAGVYMYNASTVTLDNNTITGGQNHGIAFEIAVGRPFGMFGSHAIRSTVLPQTASQYGTAAARPTVSPFLRTPFIAMACTVFTSSRTAAR